MSRLPHTQMQLAAHMTHVRGVATVAGNPGSVCIFGAAADEVILT